MNRHSRCAFRGLTAIFFACVCGGLLAQAGSMGTLRVNVQPPAQIALNHAAPSELSPVFTREIPAGVPTLIKASAPGYLPAYQTVTLGDGERRVVNLNLQRPQIPVLFRSNVPAKVLCNGEELGETPCYAFFREPKNYRIVVRAAGMQEQTHSLNLQGGAPRVFTFNLLSDSGTLVLASAPSGAQVLINGITKGTTPLTLERLREGEHTITLRQSGFKPLTHTFRIEPGQRLPLRLSLEPLPAGLTIATIPNDARVYIDNAFRGMSDLSLPQLENGLHAVRIEKAGYAPISRVISLERGETRIEEFRLVVIRGQLQVQTQPGTVTVWHGKKKLLTTAPNAPDSFTSAPANLDLPPGTYDLTLKADGYADATRQVTIKANETTRLNVRLDFRPNFTLRTARGTHQGVFVKQTADGITLELKPGTFRTFRHEEILSQGFITEAL